MEEPVEKVRCLDAAGSQSSAQLSSAELRAARSVADTYSNWLRVTTETSGEAEDRRARSRMRRAIQRAMETPEESERRKAAMRKRQAERRANETEEEAEHRKADLRWRQAVRMFLVKNPKKSKSEALKRFKHLKPKRMNEVSEDQTTTDVVKSKLSTLDSFQSSTEKLQQKTRQEEEEEEDGRKQVSYPDSNLIGEPRIAFPPENLHHIQVHGLASPAPVAVTVSNPLPGGKSQCDAKQILAIVDHQRCVMSNLTSLWKSGKLCDACIGNGSSTVMVHKVMLSAICPKLLSDCYKDILSNTFLQLNFPSQVSTKALKAFAEYMYKGMLDLNPDILEQLKIIAKGMGINKLEELCNKHLSADNTQPQSNPEEVVPSSDNSIEKTKLLNPSIPTSENSPISPGSPKTSNFSVPSITAFLVEENQETSKDKFDKVQNSATAKLDQVQNDVTAVFGKEADVAPTGQKNNFVAPTSENPLLHSNPKPESTSTQPVPSSSSKNVDIKQETSDTELDEVQKETDTEFTDVKLEVPSLATNEPSAETGFDIYPTVKIEQVGPEDNKYGRLDTFNYNNNSVNEPFPESSSSSSSSSSSLSIPKSSTELTIPFSEVKDVKPLELKTLHSFEAPSINDLRASSIDSSLKLSNCLASPSSSSERPLTSNNRVYPVGLYTSKGDNLLLLTPQGTEPRPFVLGNKSHPGCFKKQEHYTKNHILVDRGDHTYPKKLLQH